MIEKITNFKELKRKYYWKISENNKLAYFEINPGQFIKLSIDDFNLFCFENKFEVAEKVKEILSGQLKYIESVIQENLYNVSHYNN